MGNCSSAEVKISPQTYEGFIYMLIYIIDQIHAYIYCSRIQTESSVPKPDSEPKSKQLTASL